MCQGLERSWHIRMPSENGKRECIQQKHITQKEYEHYRKYGYDGEGQLMVEEVELSGRFKGYIAVIYKKKMNRFFTENWYR
mgnify:CR=1 FL=1